MDLHCLTSLFIMLLGGNWFCEGAVPHSHPLCDGGFPHHSEHKGLLLVMYVDLERDSCILVPCHNDEQSQYLKEVTI